MDAWNQDIKNKWDDLAKMAAGIIPTLLPTQCESYDFNAARTDLEVLARKVDALIEAYGDAIHSRSRRGVDMDCFRNQLSNALEGEAFYEISECAEEADKPEEPDPDYLYDRKRDDALWFA